jgi:transcriptional regulator with XRE-family HTH domain
VEKSIYTREYAVLLELLREARERAGLTQAELAKRLQQSQSFVSKVEVGDRRLDLIQLRTMCGVLGTTLPEFIAELEARLSRPERKGRPG